MIVLPSFMAFPIGAVVKNPPSGDARGSGWITGLGSFPEGEMATYSSILAWKISWKEEPGGLRSMGLQRVEHDWSDWARTPAEAGLVTE